MIHHFLQSKSKSFERQWMGGILLWLLLYRVCIGPIRETTRVPALGDRGIMVLAGALTFTLEAVAFGSPTVCRYSACFRRFQFRVWHPARLVCMGGGAIVP